MKITVTTGIITICMTAILIVGGWVVTLAVAGNDQKHLIKEFADQKIEMMEQKKKFEIHCEKQFEDISFIKESLVRIETKMGTIPRERRMGKLMEDK
jgi:hypothetical protein